MREGWALDAACRGMDPALFFPTVAGRGSYHEARIICGRCTVREDCLEDALIAEAGRSRVQKYRHGMFGGATPEERQKMPNFRRIRESMVA